jgi:transposase
MQPDTHRNPNCLPNDVEQCHALIEELTATLHEQQRQAARLQKQVEHLLKRLYGPRSERIDPGQLTLFGEQAQAQTPAPEQTAEEQAPAPKPAKGKGHGRKPLPKDLARKRIVHDAPAEDKKCPECGADKKRIGEEVSEQLEYVPASLYLLEHVRPKYACPCCEEHVAVGDKPAKVIAKGLPGPGLVSHIAISKYCDHLPLYRQEFMLARQGAPLSRKTLCGWLMRCAEKLEPLIELMKQEILSSKVLHTDDTPVRVQGGKKNGAFTGRFWVYVGDKLHPYTVYDYTPSRKRDGPQLFLDGYTGYLQADAFQGYDGIYAGGEVLEAACWAHARRYFYNARSSDPDRAHRVLAWIRQLYKIEREAKKLDAEGRRALRQEKSRPILLGSEQAEDEERKQGLRQWLIEQQTQALPKSPIAQAISYTLNNWEALMRYLDDGDIDIDNNQAEQALRSIAVGRKNWLFLGSERGGRAAAVYYSLIQSAKRHNAEPFAYLRDVLLRLTPAPPADLGALLPDRWKAALQS